MADQNHELFRAIKGGVPVNGPGPTRPRPGSKGQLILPDPGGNPHGLLVEGPLELVGPLAVIIQEVQAARREIAALTARLDAALAEPEST